MILRAFEREEHMFVEALVAKFAVERFYESVLHWLAGFAVASLKSGRWPAQHWPLVSSVPLSLTTIRSKARSVARRSSSRTTRTPPREVSTPMARLLAVEIIDAAQDAEAPPIAQCVRYEVERQRWLIASGRVSAPPAFPALAGPSAPAHHQLLFAQ